MVDMDEKEQADRLAAAEALYMISTRGPAPRISRRGRKKSRNSDYGEDVPARRKNGVGDVTVNTTSSSSPRRGGGNRGARRGRGAGGGSGSRGARTKRGSSSSPRSRSSATKHRNQQRQSVDETNQQNNNVRVKQSPSSGEMYPNFCEDPCLTLKSRSRASKLNNPKTKSNSPSNSVVGYSHELDVEDTPHQAIGITGATISIGNKRETAEFSHNLPSSGLVSGLQQASLTSRSLPSLMPSLGLQSLNLPSFTPELNLPSIPLEIGSLQLSSQPIPNLVSLGDMVVDGVMEDDSISADRKKSEKFLPLKKRKLHNPSNNEVQEPAPSVEPSSLSESEDQPEPMSSPPPLVEPVRASFTVQAPPIITMQTLMEIKTALTADDDGDLPLHIAVVHENMRMVIKLINLMRIAGKGVDKFNKQQQTPLHLAVKLNFLEAIDILLKSHANVNAVDCTGSSSIHMAVQGRSPQCLAMLLERCPHADLNVRNFDGLTPLHIAVDNGDLQQVEMLLKHNADIDVTDGKSGRTALFRAAESNQKSMVELLLSKGANPDVPNYAGVTTAMAAQGRNLHGVLKLLGAAATDKFTEYDTKPLGITLESKPVSLYLGMQSSDKQAPHVMSRNNSMSRSASQEITCLIEPKRSPDTAETPANDTKVFHNVFVFSQNHSKDKNSHTKSLSEPASPEVKMEVVEEKDAETVHHSGLMSLPEGIFSHSEAERSERLHMKPRKVTTSDGQALSASTYQEKLRVPVYYSRLAGNTKTSVQRDGQKSIMLQIVRPPVSNTNRTAGVGTLVPSSSSAPSGQLMRILSMPSESASTVSSSANLSNTPASSSGDTVTLTGIQARLFQLLLKMYNIDPASEASAGSGDGHKEACPSRSAQLGSPSCVMASVVPLGLKQGDISQLSSRPSLDAGGSGSVVEASLSFNQHAPSSHPQAGRLNDSYEQSLSDGVSDDAEQLRSEDSPLNLSTTSNRQYSQDSNRDVSMMSHKKLDVSGRPVYDSPSGPRSEVTGFKLGVNPVLVEPQQDKVISVGVRRISDGSRGSKTSGDGGDQLKMVVLPSSEHVQAGVIADSGPAHVTGVSSMASVRGVGLPNHSQGKPVVALQQDSVPLGGADSASCTPSTKIVKDHLPQHHQPITISAKMPSTLVHSLSSVPAVLDVSAELGKKKHVVTLTSISPSVITMDTKTNVDRKPSLSSALVLPTTSSQVFLHQGQVIDLSRSSLTEVSSSMSQHSSHPTSASDSGQGRIIGFSGAIISVAQAKLERQEKSLPKEGLPKETQKKRGRKSQKAVQGSTSVVEIGLGKINSETDEKLKKFLGAKKHENFLPNLPHTVGLQPDTTNRAGMEETGQLTLKQETEGQLNITCKTVGIFSGDVQHVKVGKKLVTQSSPSTPQTAPVLSSSLSKSSLLGGKFSPSQDAGVKTSDDREDTEKSSATASTFTSLITTTTGVMGKSCMIQSLASHIKLENDHDVDGEGSSRASDDTSGVHSDIIGVKLSSDSSNEETKRPKKRTSKQPLHNMSACKERLSRMLNKKDQGSRSGITECSSGPVTEGNIKKPDSVKPKRKGLSKICGDISVSRNLESQQQGRNGETASSSSGSTRKTIQNQNGNLVPRVQSPSSHNDQVKKQKKQQRQKKSKGRGLDLGSIHEQAITETRTDVSETASIFNPESKDVSAVKVQEERKSSQAAQSSSMEVDDDADDQPALVIEESIEMS